MSKRHNQSIEPNLSILDAMLGYVKEYGVINIIKSMMLLFIFGVMVHIIYNPGALITKYTAYLEAEHQKELQQRAKYDLALKRELPKLLARYHADRVWLIQYHNGTKDWQHGTLRFECCNDGIRSIVSQYDNFPLTWLELPYHLQDHELFIGTTEDLKKIDPFLAMRFEENNTQFCACIILRSKEGYPSGVLGVSWNAIPPGGNIINQKIRDRLLTDRGIFTTLLTLNLDSL